jgi:hypothetical protein
VRDAVHAEQRRERVVAAARGPQAKKQTWTRDAPTSQRGAPTNNLKKKIIGQTQHGPEASSGCAFGSAPAVGGVGVQGHEVYLAGVGALERSQAGRHGLVHTIQRRDRRVCAFRGGGFG